MCSKCGEMYSRDVNHCICDCPHFEMLRNSFNEIICRIFGEPFLAIIENLDPTAKLGIYLGSLVTEDDNILAHEPSVEFYKLSITFLSNLWTTFLAL